MKWRPNATRSALPAARIASALYLVEPPATMRAPPSLGRRCSAATGAWPSTISSVPLVRGDVVEAGDAEPVQLLGDVTEGGGGIAVGHRPVGAAGCQAHAHTVSSEEQRVGKGGGGTGRLRGYPHP